MVERAHDTAPRRCALFFHEGVAHQIAHHFAAVLRQAAASHQLVELHEQPLGHGHGETNKVVAHRSRRLDAGDGEAGGILRVIFHGLFGLVKCGAHLVEQAHHVMQLFPHRGKPGVGGQMPQIVRMAALRA